MAREEIAVFTGPQFAANIVAGLLRSNGIGCDVRSLRGAAVDLHLGPAAAARVFVAPADADDARRLIDEVEPLATEA